MKQINGTAKSETNSYKIEAYDEFGISAGFLKNEDRVAYEEDGDEVYFSKEEAIEVCRNFNFKNYGCRAAIRSSNENEFIFC